MDTIPLFAPAPPALEGRFLEPEGFRWGHFTTSDGATLRWGHLPSASAKDCILVGGFMEFIEKYFETVRDLHARGFNVWCLDWRGQGRSSRFNTTRPSARIFSRDAEDLAAFIRTVSPEGRQRLLVAHSMGAAIALLMLRDAPSLVDAAVLSAPMFEIDTGHIPRWVARLLARAMTRCGRGGAFVPGAGPWPNIAPPYRGLSRTSNDPARCKLQDVWFGAHRDLRLDGPTYGWIDAAFTLTADLQSPTFLGNIHTPILIGSAGQDILVDPAAHMRAATLLTNCRLVTFADAKHELFHETDDIRTHWLAAIEAFVAEHIPSTS